MHQRSFMILLVSTGVTVLLFIPAGFLAVWSFHPDFFGPYATLLDLLLFRIGVIALPGIVLLTLLSAWRNHWQHYYMRAWSLCLAAILLISIQALVFYGVQTPPVPIT
jgi:peptidoglycan biosynthesis protein MviN/MurJ (putative lipid II flippase)